MTYEHRLEPVDKTAALASLRSVLRLRDREHDHHQGWQNCPVCGKGRNG